jgi:hypothetical protein
VTIVRNEADYLLEWLWFHRLAGVEHVFLYDDASTDGTAHTVRPFVANGFVTYVPWAQMDVAVSPQVHAYAHALSVFGPSWRWMAFIDADEFLFPAGEETLPDALSRYEDLPAVGVPWLMFGFNGHSRRPDALIVESFTKRMGLTGRPRTNSVLRWKSIVNPVKVAVVRGAHFFRLADGTKGAFDERRRWIPDLSSSDGVTADVFRLNHYFTKSRTEFDMKRNRPTSAVKLGRTPEQLLARRDAIAAAIETETIEDRTILRYAPALRRALGYPDRSGP